MSEQEFKPLDLTKADDCREFLSSIGKTFHTSTGRRLTIKEMSDEEAIYFANQLHQEMFDGDEFIDTSKKRTLN